MQKHIQRALAHIKKNRSMKNTIIKSLCRAAMIIIVQDLRHISAALPNKHSKCL